VAADVEGFLAPHEGCDNRRYEPAPIRAKPRKRLPDDDWSHPAVGEDPRDPLPSSIAPRPTDPAVRLARDFDARWAQVCREHPELRVVRASNRGAAVGYLRSVLLPQKSAAHIEAYFDAFMDAAASGDVRIREGQFAWQRFVSWWGTTVVADPSAPTRRLVRRRRP
jgi:hypothetical protein